MAGFEGLTRFMSGAGSAEDVYGRRPVVPEFPSFSDALKEITQGNLAALPSLRKLGLESTEAYSKMMEQAYPGITELKTLGTSTIKSFLSGEMSDAEKANLRRESAEFGRQTGFGLSQFTSARELDRYASAQFGRIQQGLDSASRWIGQAQGQTFDFSRMFLGPQDAIRQAEGRFSRGWLASQVEAAPDPTARGQFDAEMSWIGMILSAYGGGAGYTQQYRPNYGGGAGGGQGMGGGGGSYFSGNIPVQNYGYGQTPPDTFYNPNTD